jgi:hypothetical protein
MKTNDNDLVTLIAGFYAERYAGHFFQPNRDYTAEMLALFGRLQQRAFPGHLFDPTEFLAQASAQLLGNELAVRNYYTVGFRLAPLSGEGKPLVIRMGATSTLATPNGTLTIWTEDQAINDGMQSVLEMVSREVDTIS